ncbi:hypothetical protein IGB42_01933 [Andreprevotia sp. IGB-42]|uniref:hypothetical protein n=1 Tax=Andreprevotia sp. IGB-42 TaxID=2497473 RepID=UPI001359706B|nr:hypothetical protein [Andreprevotia sp. IGB-42]KAF0813582.1 hypothetical protein IGB42_01933 [Andreprevotia sp. IGB-42]
MPDQNPHESATAVELRYIKDSLTRVEGVLGQVVELTKHVALVNERTENHRQDTEAMDRRLTTQTLRIEDDLRGEKQLREDAVSKVHSRVDTLKRWVYMVMGGGIVVGGLLAYAGESAKELLREIARLHDESLAQGIEIKRIGTQLGKGDKP